MFKVDCENGLNFLAHAKGLGGNSDIMNRDNGYKYKKR
jgi:translation initiation factor IF-1